MIHIDPGITEPLISQARTSARRRKNYNFHLGASDTMQRMLHAMEPETYVQPHKHENPDKREAFIILKGRVAAIEFGNNGEIIDWVILDPRTDNFGMEFPARSWHTLICLESGTLVYEVKDGPWDPSDDKFFASWAPKEGDENCSSYNQSILDQIVVLKSRI